jgi:hypothetical protein
MAEVFLESLVDLYDRKGISAEAPPRPEVCRDYGFVLATGSFHVAEAQGRIIAIAGAVIRDGLWYLSAFWARPAISGGGVGTSLLRGLHSEAVEQGAHTFATWSSQDLPAISAYLRLGLRPQDLMLRFEGTPLRLPGVNAGCATKRLEPEVAAEFDRAARGTARPADHAFFAGPSGATGRQVLLGDKVAGYYYLNRGRIGPAAWLEGGEAGSAVLSLAFREAAELDGFVGITLPGRNSLGVDVALDAGLPLAGIAHLLTSASFGDMVRYVPSGPLLL